ncbi:927_t:CDS:1 [Dentiscutata heterogama]|uniref:927_t:CDS:1 n=1 Tax=Dentiscutata heterogama TaxID=1316150 RepID=A0ACA9M7K2_9GLOM|nr:927_t:CDS:1 [Dentiscutata heterogama]
MSKNGTFSISKSQQAERLIFKLVNENKYIVIEKRDANVLVIFLSMKGQIINIPKKYKIKDICTGDMYKSHEFDRIPCFVLSNNLNDFQLCVKNIETKKWEAIFWFDKMEMFSVNHSSEIVGINRNEHLELYSRINDSIQKKIIDIETQEQQEKM